MVENPSQKVTVMKSDRGSFELDALLHPANAFRHPMDVVRDCDLTSNESEQPLLLPINEPCGR